MKLSRQAYAAQYVSFAEAKYLLGHLRVVDPASEIFVTARIHNTLHKLFYTDSELSNPLALAYHGEAAGSLSSEGSQLGGTNTFCKPDGPLNRYAFAQRLVQKDL